MIKSASGILFVALIAILAHIGQSLKSYHLKGNYIRYPQYLYLYGTVSDVSNYDVDIGYWRGFTRIENSKIKLLFAYALTNQNKRFLTMYAAMEQQDDAIDAHIVNEKYQKVGSAGILLHKSGNITALAHDQQQDPEPIYKIGINKPDRVGEFYMNLSPYRYQLGQVRITELDNYHYRVVINHLKVGFCSRTYEYVNFGGMGIDQLTVPFSFTCHASSGYAYDMKMTKIQEDHVMLHYGIRLEPPE